MCGIEMSEAKIQLLPTLILNNSATFDFNEILQRSEKERPDESRETSSSWNFDKINSERIMDEQSCNFALSVSYHNWERFVSKTKCIKVIMMSKMTKGFFIINFGNEFKQTKIPLVIFL